MTQYSYSRVSLFEDCPYHFKLRYIDKLREVPDYTANNPLIIGHALHKGIESGVGAGVKDYYDSFPVIDDRQVEEAMKLEILIPKVTDFLSNAFTGFRFIHEYKIDKPDYVGYVDLIAIAPDNTCMVIDFKYSNNVKNYMDSGQLHIYQHYLEQDGFNVQNLAYLFVPKTNLKMAKSEELYHYRKRLANEVKNTNPKLVPITYDEMNVVYFLNKIKEIESTTEYPKNVSGHCFSCTAIEAKKKGRWTVLTPPDYLDAIQNVNGEIEMILPKNERRDIAKVTKRVFWLYGAPFSGKTYFANKFPNPLMLNTDGNIRFVDAPYISISDKTEVNGRITNKTLAWDIFKDTISELEKKDNDFKTIIVDLLEDTYEACRFYEYEKLGIEHESDNSFKAWDMVRTEFLSTIKRIVHLDYENIIFLSHEDTTKDVTKKSGDKITAIKPNIQEKAANKVAGMVDIVGRVVADGDDRKIEFKSKDYVFAGGRLPKLPVTEIELDYDALIDVYDVANKNLKSVKKPKKQEPLDLPDGETLPDDAKEESVEEPKRSRRSRKNTESTEEPVTPVEESVTEEPKRKRRSRKSDDSEQTPPGEEPTEESESTPHRRRRRSRD